MDSVFNKFDDEEADEQPRKRKLVPLDYDDDKSLGVDGAGLSSIKGANTEEKRKHIKSLIEKIPTAKPELFSYSLDWSMVDTVTKFFFTFSFLLMTKITFYFTLVNDMVCSRLNPVSVL